MPRRKKRWWKPKIKASSIESGLALVLILLGFLSVLTTVAALVGVDNFLQQITWLFLGIGSLILPFNFLLAGLSLTKIKHELAQPRLLWGSLLLTINLSILSGVFAQDAGGWLGNQLVDSLASVITRIGVALASLTFIIVSILILMNTSLQNLLIALGKLSQPITAIRELFAQFQDNFTQLFHAVTSNSNASSTQAEYKNQTQGNNETGTPDQPSIEILDDQKQGYENHNSSDESSRSKDVISPPPYTPPPISLLSDAAQITTDQSNIEKNAQIIEKTLENFGIQARIVEVSVGPAVTQFAIDLAEGTKTSKITGLQNELALALASPTGSVRIESPIPGKRLIGIEVPNMSLSLVSLKHMLQSEVMKSNQSKLLVALGQDVAGRPVAAEINKWPHLLIAGQTGSGKSVLLHGMLNSILFRARPEEVSFIMVDPKRVELTYYNDIPHLQTPVIVDAEKTINAFKWAIEEMEKRYRLFQQISARNLDDFNHKTDTERLPYIVIVVDELADLMSFAANEMETLITRLAQKSRATGIYMILATQRPSVNVITGLIKANIPSRIALNVTSGTDSRVILDTSGAEKLLGRGDMLYLPPEAGRPIRIQGVFLSDEEIQKVANHLRQFTSPHVEQKVEAFSQVEPIDQSQSEITMDRPEDDKFIEAVEVILNHDKASASLLQRRLKIGYARAARIIDEMEEKGIVDTQDGSNPRDVSRQTALDYLEKLKPSL